MLFPAAAAALELMFVIAPGLSSWELGLTERRGLGEVEGEVDICVMFRWGNF